MSHLYLDAYMGKTANRINEWLRTNMPLLDALPRGSNVRRRTADRMTSHVLDGIPTGDNSGGNYTRGDLASIMAFERPDPQTVRQTLSTYGRPDLLANPAQAGNYTTRVRSGERPLRGLAYQEDWINAAKPPERSWTPEELQSFRSLRDLNS
jgi:hypothetical protein